MHKGGLDKDVGLAMTEMLQVTLKALHLVCTFGDSCVLPMLVCSNALPPQTFHRASTLEPFWPSSDMPQLKRFPGVCWSEQCTPFLHLLFALSLSMWVLLSLRINPMFQQMPEKNENKVAVAREIETVFWGGHLLLRVEHVLIMRMYMCIFRHH